ncbi:CYFA0S02e04500g1_1 [Cyberlindnera fabianii]|uniref:CYFA0S02e04500g1_1 n=1 Tax=Cyberlindnera fabianii TaxID=36022 RepID=A0A061ATH1_CYBFA|nr:Transmembrane protein 19 [Cyberlindnera fabianii]CDR38679.1 CYFA0S02e04500g1_1 [Cyberlindnera fabianii]
MELRYPLSHKFVNINDHVTIAVRALVILGVAYRAYSKKSLTTSGIVAAIITGIVHALPQSNLPLILLITFFITSSKATHYKEEQKGSKVKIPGGKTAAEQSQRTYVQVLSNSFFSTALILASSFTDDYELTTMAKAGIVTQYVAVIADTWSSEFGILSTEQPFLLTTFKKVPPGTNGGVTKLGLAAGLAGSALLSAIAAAFQKDRVIGHFFFFTIIGFMGTIIDSVMGTFMQATLVDTKDGKVLEPVGGCKVDQTTLWDNKDNLKVVTGENVLSNNQVNLIMSFQCVMLGMGIYIYIFG